MMWLEEITSELLYWRWNPLKQHQIYRKMFLVKQYFLLYCLSLQYNRKYCLTQIIGETGVCCSRRIKEYSQL